MTPASQRIDFPGSQGGRLAARLDLPAVPPVAYCLFAHCFTCSKDTRASTYLASALAARGFAVLRFDFTGLGGSEGEFANTNFSSNVADLVAAAEFLRTEFRAPELLVGHSLGGSAVLAAAAAIPSARAVATIGSPFEPGHVLERIGGRDEIQRAGEAEVDIGGRRFRIRRQFLEDVAGRRLDAALGGLRKALLVMHSPRDTIVEIENAARIFAAARHPKSFLSLDPADHLLSRREDAAYAAEFLAAWAQRYVAGAVPGPPSGVAGKVVVRETCEGKFAQHVVAGRHVLRADEPTASGGLDSGISPYDFLLAGLGACTATTLRLYAERKHLPLERVTVEPRHDKLHTADCADCESRAARIDRIERLIRLEGTLAPADRAKLLEIADKCPVHRTLHGEIEIPTRLMDD